MICLDRTRVGTALVLTLLLLGSAVAAHAVDGVLEINAACVADGCFALDPAGFPVVLAVSGSYRLTSNLLVPNENTTAITVTADDVSIDLNGFTIAGVTSCSGNPVTSCTPTGSGKGISRASVSITNTVVKNGTIRGTGNRGVELGRASHASGLLVLENGTEGIHCLQGCTVEETKTLRNGGSGIYQSVFATAPEVSFGSIFRNNVTSGNGGYGIRTNDFGSLTIDNVAYQNADEGVAIFGVGSYARNTLYLNNGGADQVGGTGTEIGTNLCGTNTTCP